MVAGECCRSQSTGEKSDATAAAAAAAVAATELHWRPVKLLLIICFVISGGKLIREARSRSLSTRRQPREDAGRHAGRQAQSARDDGWREERQQ